MPPFSEQSKIQKALCQFRLVTARSIIRNKPNLFDLQGDIDFAEHVFELCDRYSMRLLINWLAAKWRFPAYASSIEGEAELPEFILETWPALAFAYPLDPEGTTDFDRPFRKQAWQEACRILDALDYSSLDLIGLLYEQFNARQISLSLDGEIDIQKSNKRRIFGQFYTPLWVVHYCFDIALGENLNRLMNAIKAISTPSPDKHEQNSKQIRILDPSCGSGNFLLGACSYFEQKGLSAEDIFTVIKHCLYGIDLDARAASLCRIALVLKAAPYFAGIGKIRGQEALNQELLEFLLHLRKHIIVADSLFQSESSHCPSSAKFDIVVGNPPYVSFGARNQRLPAISWVKYLRRKFPAASEYKLRLHSIFQEVSLAFAKPSGKVVLLLPDAFLTGRYYEKLRLSLLAKAKILSLSELPRDTIPGATVGNWCVASYEKKISRQSFAVKPDDYLVLLEALKPPKKFQLPVSCLVSKDRSRFRLVFSLVDQNIWLKMDKLAFLGDVLEGHTGIRSQIGQSAILARESKGINWRKGIASGGQVLRHEIVWDGTWIDINPENLFAGGFDKLIVESPKLLVRQTGDCLVASYDGQGLYHLNNVHCFAPRSGQNPNLYFLDGLMNSSFWFYLYQAKSREAGCALAQIDIEMVESMPYQPGAEDLEKAIGKLVRLAGLARDRRTNWNKNLCAIERSIDRLVYDLYSLTCEEVEHVEQVCRMRAIYAPILPSHKEALILVDQLADPLLCENRG